MKRILDRIGAAGVVAIALLAAALLFSNLAVKPMEARSAALKGRKIETAAPTGEKVAAVYQHLAKEETTTDWLAKLHGIGAATGVQFRSASYKTLDAEGRLVRYEIVLPVSGSYGQIRDFMKRALAEIPVMSVDQVTLKKAERKGGTLQADLRLTLHMVKS